MDALILKAGLIASLTVVSGCFVYKYVNLKDSDHLQLESTTAAFESLESDFKAINTNVDREFNKLPKYEKQSKDQPIKDALEFVKFSKQTFTDTMGQNDEIFTKTQDFGKKVNEVLEK